MLTCTVTGAELWNVASNFCKLSLAHCQLWWVELKERLTVKQKWHSVAQLGTAKGKNFSFVFVLAVINTASFVLP